MATIDDLAKSITELSDQEAFDLIKRLRFSRRVAKASNKKSAKRAAKKKPKVLNLASALGMMSAEQKAQLLSELTGD